MNPANRLVIDPQSMVLSFVMRMPIRWGDMDAMGHVNNTIYFRYLEQTRISWFNQLGFVPDRNGQGPVIANAYCNFIRELVYPGLIECRQYLGEIGRSSFEALTVISRVDDPATQYATGGARVVWVDYPKRKSAPMPEDVLKLIQRPFSGPALES